MPLEYKKKIYIIHYSFVCASLPSTGKESELIKLIKVSTGRTYCIQNGVECSLEDQV